MVLDSEHTGYVIQFLADVFADTLKLAVVGESV
jgi:hypothetical protein